ncbi:NAD(P)/FAD-dependent oxidoreductase [Piscinibacter sakaiensis]|uniref:Cyclohexanone monooxygenase n=1 Tax=Piscinibacter sakaiensis TaxID=1547922 RepID=A0A0K8NUM4_PISS1|nr:NAD(P)/FAD-dependent oxidoreductase [Piscinibacter sakaiensis]GAP34092.1 cyclohexanone monooxygenase [Piscinibacter sakaiensis]
MRIVVIGAGFAGLCVGALLKRAGFDDLTLLERGDDVGGVWRENRYPGAACDVPTPLYSYSFEHGHAWTAAYAAQPEMLRYLQHCARQHGLAPHLRLGACVTQAHYARRDARWTLHCSDGAVLHCDVLIPAVGIFNTPMVPDFPHADSFTGAAFHSAQWRDDVELRGRRIAVIGSGASAVQIVPELAKVAERVDVVQRSPLYVMPRKPVDMGAMASERARLFREFDAVAERRKSPAGAQAAQQAFADHLVRSVRDPALRRALTPDFLFGCKRTLFSDDWYPTLQKPNVRPIFAHVERLTPAGIAFTDGTSAEVDVIVYATGFKPASYLPGMEVRADGMALHDAWRQGARAHLGISVAGFPNLFFMYGPNTNVAGSVVHMHECQAGYIVQCLQAMADRGAASMEVRPDVMARSCDQVHQRLAASVMDSAHCSSYAMDAAGRIVVQYPGSQSDYEQETARADLGEFVLE